jgi:hypothetical protein
MWRIFLVAFVFFVACGIYSNSLSGPFLYDDDYVVVENMDLRSETPLVDLLYHDFWGQVQKSSHARYLMRFYVRILHIPKVINHFGRLQYCLTASTIRSTNW